MTNATRTPVNGTRRPAQASSQQPAMPAGFQVPLVEQELNAALLAAPETVEPEATSALWDAAA
jgi:hypothetical protein